MGWLRFAWLWMTDTARSVNTCVEYFSVQLGFVAKAGHVEPLSDQRTWEQPAPQRRRSSRRKSKPEDSFGPGASEPEPAEWLK
jgi:hypothetical protein